MSSCDEDDDNLAMTNSLTPEEAAVRGHLWSMILMIGAHLSLLAAYLVIRTHHSHPLIWVHFKVDHPSQSCKSMYIAIYTKLQQPWIVTCGMNTDTLKESLVKPKEVSTLFGTSTKNGLNKALREMQYCFPCRVFGNRETSFTVVRFTSWNKATERFSSHVGTSSIATCNRCIV